MFPKGGAGASIPTPLHLILSSSPFCLLFSAPHIPSTRLLSAHRGAEHTSAAFRRRSLPTLCALRRRLTTFGGATTVCALVAIPRPIGISAHCVAWLAELPAACLCPVPWRNLPTPLSPAEMVLDVRSISHGLPNTIEGFFFLSKHPEGTHGRLAPRTSGARVFLCLVSVLPALVAVCASPGAAPCTGVCVR